jgi:hypothetical protein
VVQEADSPNPWQRTLPLPFEELFYFIRILIGQVLEAQIRNDECSMLTAVSVRSDGRTERAFNPILHLVPATKNFHAAVWSQS